MSLSEAKARFATRATLLAKRPGDLLHDDRRLRQPEPGAAILLGDQRRHPAGPGQRVNEVFRIGALLVDLAVILGRELGAKRPNGVADVPVRCT